MTYAGVSNEYKSFYFLFFIVAAYCRRCLSAVLNNPFKSEENEYNDIEGPTEEQLFLRQGMIELG